MTWNGNVGIGPTGPTASIGRTGSDVETDVNLRILRAEDHTDCGCPDFDCLQVWGQTNGPGFIAKRAELIVEGTAARRATREGLDLDLSVQIDPKTEDGIDIYDGRLPHLTLPQRELCGIYPLAQLPRSWRGRRVQVRLTTANGRLYSNVIPLPPGIPAATFLSPRQAA